MCYRISQDVIRQWQYIFVRRRVEKGLFNFQHNMLGSETTAGSINENENPKVCENA